MLPDQTMDIYFGYPIRQSEMFEIHPDPERFGYDLEVEEEEEDTTDPWLVDETESGPLLDENGDPINPLEKIFEPEPQLDQSSTVDSLGGADDPPFVNPLLHQTEYTIGDEDPLDEDVIRLDQHRIKINGVDFQIVAYPHDFWADPRDDNPIVGAVGFYICELEHRGELIDQNFLEQLEEWSSGRYNEAARATIQKFCQAYEIEFDPKQCGIRSIRSWCRCCS